MNILEIIQPKKEKNYTAKFECTLNNLAQTFKNVTEQHGMLNPKGVVSKTTKAIQIKKINGKYIIYINLYTPPLELEWVNLNNPNSTTTILSKLADINKKIGFVNIKQLQNGNSIFQMAIA